MRFRSSEVRTPATPPAKTFKATYSDGGWLAAVGGLFKAIGRVLLRATCGAGLMRALERGWQD